VNYYAQEFAHLASLGLEIGIVIGGGNFFRGSSLAEQGLNRIVADQIGMMATVMNSLALQDALEALSVKTALMSSSAVNGVCEGFERRKAMSALTEKHIVLFAGGTGNPLFTTDTCASLRAIEINAELLVKVTRVGGVYDQDPRKSSEAKILQTITFDQAIEKKYGVMDLTSFLQCKEHGLDLIICNIDQKGTLQRVLSGEPIGSKIISNKKLGN
jgi:uridylate kinase